MSCADCGCIFWIDEENNRSELRCPNCGGENILIHNEDGDEWKR